MKITLNRHQVLLLSICFIFTIVIINRIGFILESNITTGRVIDFEIAPSISMGGRYGSSGGSIYYRPIVQYQVGNTTYVFKGVVGDFFFIEGEIVDVIYKRDLSEARIYSFRGFWLPFYEMVFLIILIAVVIAASYSFIESKERLIFGLGRKLVLKKTKQEISSQNQIQKK